MTSLIFDKLTFGELHMLYLLSWFLTNWLLNELCLAICCNNTSEINFSWFIWKWRVFLFDRVWCRIPVFDCLCSLLAVNVEKNQTDLKNVYSPWTCFLYFSHMRQLKFEEAYHTCTFKYRGNFSLDDVNDFIQNQDCLNITGGPLAAFWHSTNYYIILEMKLAQIRRTKYFLLWGQSN